MTRICSLLLLAATLVACGGGTSSTTEEADPVDTTSGGEAAPEHPIRATVPVPVPQPAVVREEMSEPLQSVWTQIEETVAIRPPEPPEVATAEAVQAWSEGPFTEWLDQRREHMRAVIQTSEGVEDQPPFERAVSAALMGYAMEDLAADVRGAPVPEDIAADEELLGIYVQSLQRVLRPIATEAVVYYAYCQQRIAALGDESEWLPWRAYCVQRGQEMIEVYELQPAEPPGPPPEEEPPPADEPAAAEDEEPQT